MRASAVRRLVEHDRAPLGGDLGEPRGAPGALAGQEPLEDEAPGGQAAGHERGDRRRRARARPRRRARRRRRPAPAARPGRRCRASRRRSPPPPARRAAEPVEHAGDGAAPRCGRSRRRAAGARRRRAGAAGRCGGCPRSRWRRRRPSASTARGRQVAEVADGRADQHERHRSVLAARAGRRRRAPSGRRRPPRPRARRGPRSTGRLTRWRRSAAVRSTTRSRSSQATSIGNRMPRCAPTGPARSSSAPSTPSRPSRPLRRAARGSGHLERGQHLPVRDSQPMAARLGGGGGPQTLKRISITSPSSTT